MTIKTPYLTVEEAAARLGCSATTIWRLIRRGALRDERFFGRHVVLVEDVERVEEEREERTSRGKEARDV